MSVIGKASSTEEVLLAPIGETRAVEKAVNTDGLPVRFADMERLIAAVGDAIVNTDTRPDMRMSDNVAVMVVSSYEDDSDCPDEEPDEELHWKPWALAQEKALRRRMAVAAIRAYEKFMGSTPAKKVGTVLTDAPGDEVQQRSAK